MANIKLSAAETELAANKEILLLKNEIIEKIKIFFGELSHEYRLEIKKYLYQFPIPVSLDFQKISRGENHEGFPYIMLDFPAIFSHENVFAIRSFFWWGNFCSITLHLKGIYKTLYVPKILAATESKNWMISMSGHEWMHSLEKNHYRYLAQCEMDDPHFISNLEKPFFKLARKMDLNDWRKMPQFFKENFECILKMLSA
ncbi:MAG: hypothetical protein JSS67_08420 [Bacteroidetes bacterium]|nr:hypothetical protein [Bacteroidota bacterium]